MSKGEKVRFNLLMFMFVLVLTFGMATMSQAQILSENFEGTFPPTGWTVTNEDGGPVVWHRSDQAPNYGVGIPLPMSGYFAYAESYPAYCGFSYDTSIVSPAFSTVGINRVMVQFDFQYWVYSTEYLALDYRIGADPWVNIENLPSIGGYTAQTRLIDISATAGNPSVQLRWRYYNLSAGCDWWASIDNVVITEANCVGEICYVPCTPGSCLPSHCTISLSFLPPGCFDEGQVTFCGCAGICPPPACTIYTNQSPRRNY
jgi:hypothetical protein